MTANRLEEKTQQFWEASLACRGFTPYVDGQTFASMIVRLEPLRYQGEFHKIRNHAEELIDMLVHDKQERVAPPTHNEVVPFILPIDRERVTEHDITITSFSLTA